MSLYQAPNRDIQFLLFAHLRITEVEWFKQSFDGLESNDLSTIIEMYAKFCESEVAPSNSVGDQVGVHRRDDGSIKVPTQLKAAYHAYRDQGWSALVYPQKWGGQALPIILRTIQNEIFSACNMALSTYIGLSQFVTSTIVQLGNDRLKTLFLPNMVNGQWTGTMCMTEPHCGSDLGLIRTKAKAGEDGLFQVSGSKIFITGGQHDMSENIVHLVLARVEGAVAGTHGLSLFVVPKFWGKTDAHPGKDNHIHCSSIEHKMGIHGSATCVLNFESSQAYLLGHENQGLKAMFVCINEARLGTSIQSLGVADAAFYKALQYALERRQSRAVASPDLSHEADTIIQHADVRRMLMLQKSLLEGARALCYETALMIDKRNSLDADSEQWHTFNGMLHLVTPVCKGFISEIAVECCLNAIQVFGGHGYIRESGVEQHLRDVKLTTIYEGTTGIQGIDLLAKKIIMNPAKPLYDVNRYFSEKLSECYRCQALKLLSKKLEGIVQQWLKLPEEVAQKAASDANEVAAVATDYLMLTGYVLLGYQWLLMASSCYRLLSVGQSAAEHSAAGQSDEFLQAKINTANFYFDKILNRCHYHISAIESGASVLNRSDKHSFMR